MADVFHVDRIFKNADLSSNEQKILAAVLQDPSKVQKAGIRQLAQSNFTSPATIERLAKKLHFNSYSELLYYAKHLKQNPNEAKSADLDQLSPLTPLIFQKRLLSILNPDNFIYIYGEGFNEFVTGYIYRKLLLHHFQVVLLNGMEIPLIYQKNQQPVLLLISRSGENFSCLQKIQQIRAVNGAVMGITANGDSTISKQADLPIQLPDYERTDSANVSYTTFFGDCINTFEALLRLAEQQTKTQKKRET